MRLILFTKVKDKVSLNNLCLLFNILIFKDIFELEMCKFMYSQYNNLLPEVFADYFTLVSRSHSYNIRKASEKFFYVSRMYTSKGQSSSLYLGVKLWNNIPKSV